MTPMYSRVPPHAPINNSLDMLNMLHDMRALVVLDRACRFIKMKSPVLLFLCLCVNLLILLTSTIVFDRHLFAKGKIDVFQRPLFGFREEEVDVQEMQSSRDDEDQEELPTDLVQCDGASDQKDDGSEVKPHHTNSHALTSDMCWEDFSQVQELTSVEECGPEKDEEEDEEDGGSLACDIVSAEERCLHRSLTTQGNHDSSETCEHERSATDLVNEEGGEDVAGEGGGDPEGREEEGHVCLHPKAYVKEHPVVCYDTNDCVRFT
jgi:hypothetical protein